MNNRQNSPTTSLKEIKLVGRMNVLLRAPLGHPVHHELAVAVLLQVMLRAALALGVVFLRLVAPAVAIEIRPLATTTMRSQLGKPAHSKHREHGQRFATAAPRRHIRAREIVPGKVLRRACQWVSVGQSVKQARKVCGKGREGKGGRLTIPKKGFIRSSAPPSCSNRYPIV
jgi:hypothetical protein